MEIGWCSCDFSDRFSVCVGNYYNDLSIYNLKSIRLFPNKTCINSECTELAYPVKEKVTQTNAYI